MGVAQNQPFQLSFNPALRVGFQGSRVTSDSGLILVRMCGSPSGRFVTLDPGVVSRMTTVKDGSVTQ
jgi:hypothetical protein